MSPPKVVVDKLLRDCALAPEQLTIILTPTRSLAGMTQVVARVLEVALHKAHELHFALEHIVDGFATAPLPAPCADGVQAMGRTNDAILYGGRVHLSGERRGRRGARPCASNCRRAIRPTSAARSPTSSRPSEYDFYKIDGALFAPAEAWVSHLDSGQTWRSGQLDLPLLRRQWLA